MRTTTANYDTENAKLQKKPVVVVEFDGITRKYSSQTFGDISANHKKYIKSMRTDLLGLDLLNGKTNFGQTEFEIVDKDLDVTDTLLKTNDIEGRDTTVKVGYQALNDADFVSFAATKIDSVQLLSDLLTWRFVSRDTISKLDKKIFIDGPVTTVQTAYTSGAATLEVASTTDFAVFPPSGQPRHDWMKAYLIVDGDVMNYTGTAAGPTRFTTVSNGALGSPAGDHAVGAEVRQVFGISVVTAMHMLLVVLLSGDPNGGALGDNHDFYDMRAGNGNKFIFGVDLTTNDVNVTQIEQLGWKYFEDRYERCTYVIGNGSVNAISWLSENIFKPTGTYLYERNGKLEVGILDWLEINENYTADDTLGNANIAIASDGTPTGAKMKLLQKDLLNAIEIRYGGQSLGTEKRFEFDSSVTAYGARSQGPLTIKTPHVLNSAAAGWIGNAWMRRWMYFFGNIHAEYELDVLASKWLLEGGDMATVTFDKFPDLLDGTRGWTSKKSLITDLNIEWLPNPRFTITGRTWEILDRVAKSGMYTVTKSLTTGAGNLGFNADNSATVNIGTDVFISLSGPTNIDVLIAFVDLTEPNTATANDEYVSIGLHVQSASGTDAYTDNRPYIRFSPSGSAVANLAFMITLDAQQASLDSLKLDFYARSGAGADDPTLNFKEVWAFTLDESITEV
jgi:hypothetical protein